MSSVQEPPLDALVVGAGPVGLMLASELRRHGAACRSVDRAPAATDKSRAVVLLEFLETYLIRSSPDVVGP